MKSIYVLSFLCLSLIAIPSESWGGEDFNGARTVKIGILAPAQWKAGQGIIQAAQLAAEEINAGGGILGKNLELFIGDTETGTGKSVKALQKLVLEDKVHALIGGYASGLVLVQINYLPRYKVPFIGTGAGATTLTEKVARDYSRYKYFFQCMIGADKVGLSVRSFILEAVKPKLELQKIAILAENAKWAYNFTFYIDKELREAGLEVVFKEYFYPETREFSSLLNKVRESGAQYLVEVLSDAASVQLVSQWADTKWIPLGGINIGSIEGTFWDKVGGAALGEMVSHLGGFRVPVTPKTVPFFDRYTQRWGETPHYTSFFTYDAVYTLAEALKAVQSLEPDAIVKGLEEVSYAGVTGQIEFQKENHSLKFGEGYPGVIFVQWQEGGKRAVIWPPSLKTGDLILPTRQN